MKILYLVPTCAFSGGENVTLQIAQRMQARGHVVAYCSPCGSIEASVVAAGVPFIGIERFSLRQVHKAIRNFRPDVVYAMDYRASLYASLIFEHTIGHLHSNCPWLKKICPNSIALFLTALRAKKLICVAQSISDDFVLGRLVKRKFTVLPNVSDIRQIEAKSKMFSCGKTYELGYCGRLSEPKNPLGFLQVVETVRKAMPEVHAVMIGDGELRQQTERVRCELHLEDSVELVGFQVNPFPYIAACRVMVMPSIWEGFPMAAIEALSLGKPLVATPVSGLRDIITDECGGVRDSIGEIAQRVLECLNAGQAQQLQMQQRAQAVAVAHSDINSYVDTIERITKNAGSHQAEE